MKSIHELCLVDRHRALFYFLNLCHPEPQFIGEGQRTKNDILFFTEKNNLPVLESSGCKLNNIFYLGRNKFIRTSPL